MSDDVKREIKQTTDMLHDVKSQLERIDDLKREVGKAIDMLYDTKSRLGRLEEELKKEFKSIKYTLEEIKNKINQ